MEKLQSDELVPWWVEVLEVEDDGYVPNAHSPEEIAPWETPTPSE